MQDIGFIYATCILVLLITLLGVIFSKNHNKDQSKRFLILLISTIAFILLSFFSEYGEKIKFNDVILFLVNLFSFYAVDVIIISFLYYISYNTKNKEPKISAYLKQVIFILSIIRITLVTVLCLTGNVFVIEDGAYVETSRNYIPYIVSSIIIAMIIVITILNRKFYSRRQLTVILLYEFIIIPFFILELVTGIYYLVAVGLTLVILMIYILFQESILDESKTKQELLEEILNTDLLTGLRNRRAYYEFIQSLKQNENMCVIYCDINGLKYVNDHYGHLEGDELIKKFSSLMTKEFEVNSCFRISGDEFVIIINGCDLEKFTEKCLSFKQIMSENKNIASIGYTFGKANCYINLVQEAETEMYKDKEILKIKR